jgi:hypothetical protein
VKTRYCCSRERGSGDETGGLSLSKSGAPRELNDEWGKATRRKVDGVDLVDRVDAGTTEAAWPKDVHYVYFVHFRPRARSLTIRLQTHPGCDDRKALLQIN